MSYSTKLPIFSGRLDIPAPISLEVSELEMLRVALEKEPILAKSTLQKILGYHGLDNINVDNVLRQIKTLASLQQYDTVYEKKHLSPLFPVNSTQQNALHLAAREGDLEEIKKLIKNHYDVNAKDIFSTTPLHMAAMYGHENVLAYLLKHDAQINSKAYVNYQYFWSFNSQFAYTPLDLAVKYSPNVQTIEYLLKNNAISGNWKYLQLSLAESIQDSIWIADYAALDLTLSKIELLAKYSNTGLWIDYENYLIPMPIFLEVEAKATSDINFHQRLIQSVDIISSADHTETLTHFLRAKNLLHVFPSNNDYQFQVGNYQAVLPAAGYELQPTVNLATHSLYAYCTTIKNVTNDNDFHTYETLAINAPFLDRFENYVELKRSVFANMHAIFEEAVLTTQKAAIHEWSEKLYNDYLSGKTILIATGWTGHAIDIILNKELNLIMVANAGNSHSALSPGLNAYNHKFNLSAEDIYDILNNQDKIALEFKYFYDLGLVKNEEYSFQTDYQLYNNCAWNSQKIAEEALLFLSLKKATHDHELSQQLTASWFEEFDNFHQISVLKDYLDKPSLELAALGDIFVNYHGIVETPHQKESAKLIFDILSHPSNIEVFNEYYLENAISFSTELKLFITDNGYELTENGFRLSENGVPLSLEDIIENPVMDDPLALFEVPAPSSLPLDSTAHSHYRQVSPVLLHEELPDNPY